MTSWVGFSGWALSGLLIAVGMEVAVLEVRAQPLASQSTQVQWPQECQPTATQRDTGFRRRRLRDGKWQMTVTLGRCVNDQHALQMVLAIRDNRLVNRLQVVAPDDIVAALSFGKTPQVPTVNVNA